MINNLFNAISLIFMSGTCLLGAGYSNSDLPNQAVQQSTTYATGSSCVDFGTYDLKVYGGMCGVYAISLHDDFLQGHVNPFVDLQTQAGVSDIPDTMDFLREYFNYITDYTINDFMFVCIDYYNIRIVCPQWVDDYSIDFFEVATNYSSVKLHYKNHVRDLPYSTLGNNDEIPWTMIYCPLLMYDNVGNDYIWTDTSESYNTLNDYYNSFMDYWFTHTWGNSNTYFYLRLHVGHVNSFLGNEYDLGYGIGFSDGKRQGYDQGYTTGKSDGYDVGYAHGVTAGYNTGLQEGLEQAQTGDFWSLFGAIADTPVKMIYSLFNFDLFGISMLSVVLTLLTGIIVFGIVKRFIK